MAKFNPDFWETTLESESWQQFSLEDGLGYECPEDAAWRHRRAERAAEIWPAVERIMNEVLTERQRQIVVLHFFKELNQRQIAEALGITQQAVGEHLYGKHRNGHMVGGALRKLHKACALRGVNWP